MQALGAAGAREPAEEVREGIEIGGADARGARPAPPWGSLIAVMKFLLIGRGFGVTVNA